MAQPKGYSRIQIVLHWTIAALVIFQLLVHDGMEDAWDDFEDGDLPDADTVLWAYLHVAVGVTILALSIVRLGVRLVRGAPPLPENHSALLKLVAWATHVLLYGFILLMPLTGALAWFGGVGDSADIHELGRLLLIPLVLLHAAGGLAEHFVFRTNSLRRMLGMRDRH